MSHCPTHDCKCHTENLAVTSETTGIRVVNYIMAESSQTLYGTIYYDIAKDMLFFKNRKGVEYELFTKVKLPTYPIINETKHTIINPFVFRGTWAYGYSYTKNDIVSDPYTKDIWIAMCNIESSHKIDSHWALLIPYPKIQPITLTHDSEVINNGFFDTTESEKHTNLQVTNTSTGIPFFYGICVSDDSKYTIDLKTKVSITLNDSTEDISKPSMYSDIKIEKSNEMIIPINFVGKNDVQYFDYNNKKMYIVKKGYYKITYNIVCSGFGDSITTYVNTETSSHTTGQVSASVKKTKDSYISHTFILPVDEEIQVKLVCTYTGSNDLLVTPINTWFLMEYMNSL